MSDLNPLKNKSLNPNPNPNPIPKQNLNPDF